MRMLSTARGIILVSFVVGVLANAAFAQNSVSLAKPAARNVAGPTWAIVIHGGAGSVPPEAEQDKYNKSLEAHLRLGQKVLAEGGTALDACERVMRAFEEDPLFNVGKGAIYTGDGTHSLDASIMDGKNLRLGAVAGVRTVKHPVTLARLVMEKTPHVLLIREGAEAFSEKMGFEPVPNTYFDTPHQLRDYEQWKEAQAQGREVPHEGGGTAGCVCLDQHGNLAACTSTGGLLGVMKGRVGDSPICGAGTYANNRTCAVSGTGTGEEFIRHNVAHTISALIQYKGLTPQQAADEVVFKTLRPEDGGVIVVGRGGEIAMAYNTTGMFRGAADSTGRFEYGVTKDLVRKDVAR